MGVFKKGNKPVLEVPHEPLVNDAPWMKFVNQEMGNTEIAGPKNNPRISEYFEATTLGPQPDQTPWCSAFANWVMGKAGIKGTKSAAALSWKNWGIILDKPRYGCIVVFDHGNGKGHVSFFVREEDGLLVCRGGNQQNSVRDSKYGRAELVGFRWPA